MKIKVMSPPVLTVRTCSARQGNTGRLFRYPFHAWTYDLDGHLIAAPFTNETVGLKTLKSEAYVLERKVEI